MSKGQLAGILIAITWVVLFVAVSLNRLGDRMFWRHSARDVAAITGWMAVDVWLALFGIYFLTH